MDYVHYPIQRRCGHIKPPVLQPPPIPQIVGLQRLLSRPPYPRTALPGPMCTPTQPILPDTDGAAFPSGTSSTASDQLPQQVYEKGQRVEYFSSSVSDWIQAVVEDVCPKSGNVRLNCNRASELNFSEQRQKLRLPSRPNHAQIERVIKLISDPEFMNDLAEKWWNYMLVEGESDVGVEALQRGLTAIEKEFGLPRTHHIQGVLGKIDKFAKTHCETRTPQRNLMKDEWHSLLFHLMWNAQEENANVLCVTSSIQKKDTHPQSLYEIQATLGKGTFGTVYRARHLVRKELRAIKKIPRAVSNMPVEYIEREIASMRSLDHPHLVKLYEYFDHLDNYYLVMGLCDGSTLHETMTANQHHPVEEMWTAQVIKQVLLAVNYVHARGLIHRDLKNENVMLIPTRNGALNGSQIADWSAVDDPPYVVVIDMGVVSAFRPDSNIRPCGTPLTMSPETWEGTVSPKSDIFSVGCLLFELLAGENPFKLTSIEDAHNFWRSRPAFRKHRIKQSSDAAVALCTVMSCIDPEGRPTAQGCLKLTNDWIELGRRGIRRHEDRPREDKPLLSCRCMVTLEQFSELDEVQKAMHLLIASQIPGHRMAEVSQQFHAVDRDGLGVLCVSEFSQVLQTCGMTKQDANRIAKGINMSRTGTIGWTEFLAASLASAPQELEAGLQLIYMSYNPLRKPSVDRSDIERLLDGELKAIGLDQPVAERLQLLDALDPTESKSVSWQRFWKHFWFQPARAYSAETEAVVKDGMEQLLALGCDAAPERSEYLLRKYGSVAAACDRLFSS